MSPQVTIGVPVYNGERFLRETLRHLSDQEFGDIEIVVSDNGSTDATEEIVRSAQSEDRRILYYRMNENHGMGWNFNRTLALADSPLFMWNAADDLAKPGYVRRCVSALSEAPQARLAFSSVEVIDEYGSVIATKALTKDTFSSPDPASRISGFLRSEAWDVVFGVAQTRVLRALGGLPYLVGDDVILGVDMLLRAPMTYVEEPLFQRRRHGAQSSEQHSPISGAIDQDPNSRPWLSMKQWRLNAELYRRALRADFSVRQRAACCNAIFMAWTLPKRRRLVGDLRRSAATLRNRARSSASSSPDRLR